MLYRQDKRAVKLSEAINSMFRWYEKSAICYAYLSDVHQGQLDQVCHSRTWLDASGTPSTTEDELVRFGMDSAGHKFFHIGNYGGSHRSTSPHSHGHCKLAHL